MSTKCDVEGRLIYFTCITGDISSTINTWPIYNTECQTWPKPAKLSYSRVYIFKSKTCRTKLHHIFKKKMAKLCIETINVNFKQIKMW